jgi:hypothetical protein
LPLSGIEGEKKHYASENFIGTVRQRLEANIKLDIKIIGFEDVNYRGGSIQLYAISVFVIKYWVM